MNLDLFYPWLKAGHVAAALVFVAGVLGVGVFLISAPDGAHGPGLARAVRRWEGRLTTPAMLLVWALGLTLAIAGHWFVQPWLMVKLLLVVALSGLHGVQSGQLRRLARGEAPRASPSPWIAVMGVVAIAVLAVVKPA